MLNRKEVVGFLFPSYIRVLDLANYNARFRSWASRHKGVRQFASREMMYDYIQDEFLTGQAIDFLEFGVYKGASIRHWCSLNRAKTSRFFGFDSFEGLPSYWNKNYPEGAFDTRGETPDIQDERVEFVKGWFQDTLPAFLSDFKVGNRLIIHNDSDLYSSTLYVLAKLDAIICPGTIVIFDEFSSPLHEFRAFEDYLASFRRSAKPIAICGRQADQVAFLFE